MSASDKKRGTSSSSHQNCRYISSHTTLEQQTQCLATKVSKLSLNRCKSIRPCRVVEDNTNTVKLRPRLTSFNNKTGIVNRLSVVTITDEKDKNVHQKTKKRPASTEDIISTGQPPLDNKRNSAQLTTGRSTNHLIVNRLNAVTITAAKDKIVHQKTKKRTVSTEDIVSTGQPALDNTRNSAQLTTGKSTNHLIVNRLNAVTITDAKDKNVHQKTKKRPVSTEDIVSTGQPALDNKRNSAQLTTGKSTNHLIVNRLNAVTTTEGKGTTVQQKSKQRPVSTEDIISTGYRALDNKRNSDQLTPENGTNLLITNRLSTASITDTKDKTVYRKTKQRPVSTGDIFTTRLSAFYNQRNSAQRLHPDWRKIPWKLYFGWTDDHTNLCKHLQYQVRRGLLESIYYKSASEHYAASMTWGQRDPVFLGGPAVNTAREALELIRSVHGHQVPSPKVVPGYDGDVEDVA